MEGDDPKLAGIGRRLLQEAIQQARAAGCCRITLLTDAGNVAAQEFFWSGWFCAVGDGAAALKL